MTSHINDYRLKYAAEKILKQAKKIGASSVDVSINHSRGMSVTVRQGKVETLEYNNDTSLILTVYFGHSKASASTSDISDRSISDAVQAACGIAKHTQIDK